MSRSQVDPRSRSSDGLWISFPIRTAAGTRAAAASSLPVAVHLLAALHPRDRTGEGAYLELAQYETATRLLDVELADAPTHAGRVDDVRAPGRLCGPHDQ